MMSLKKLVRRLLPLSLLNRVEKFYRQGRGLFWQIRYGFPARGMRVIAVTGTNGKSTTCAYINEVLKEAGYKTAVLSTVFYEINGKREPNETHFTISKQSIVQAFFIRAKKADVDWVIIEATSHAIDQNRLMGVPVKIAVITNLTQDHLDYHGTMEKYAAAKARLLSEFKPEHAVLNADDKWYGFFTEQSPKETEIFSVGKKAKVCGRLGKSKISAKGGEVDFATKSQKIKLKTSLVGAFNLQNAAMAAAVGSIFLLDKKIITKGIANVKSLEGRMEKVDAGQDFSVYVDFAITPDALDNALVALQAITEGKVRVVFGATGDRDKEKRPIMGEIATKKADFIYLTDDETYTEDPDDIRDAVYKGIEKARGKDKTKVIADRKKAIEEAVNDAKKGDSILVTGLGHENERNMGGKLMPWQDRAVVLKALKNSR
jgi:UDP-N-acetylmuramoyl-L-alanyl-D-glutamate--2,6-diaminopimelate ligase